MNATLAITVKELTRYFTTPVGYIVYAAALFLQGIALPGIIGGIAAGAADGVALVESIVYLYLIISPAFLGVATLIVAVELFTREWDQSTITLLITSPVTDGQIVVGKLLASAVFLLAVMLVSLYIPLAYLGGTDFSWTQMLIGYLGIFLMMMQIMVICAFYSALVKNVLSAFVLSTLTIVFLIFLHFITAQLNAGGDGSLEAVANVLDYLSHWGHYATGLTRGQIELGSIVYYLSAIVIFALMTVKVLESRRWK